MQSSKYFDSELFEAAKQKEVRGGSPCFLFQFQPLIPTPLLYLCTAQKEKLEERKRKEAEYHSEEGERQRRQTRYFLMSVGAMVASYIVWVATRIEVVDGDADEPAPEAK